MARRRWWRGVASSLAAGAAVAIVFSTVSFLGKDVLRPLALTLADTLFIREGGPVLGTRPPHPDIVLVLWDFKSVLELDGAVKPTILQDLLLYKTLLDEGARVVADTAPVVWDSPDLKPLTDGMVANGATGRLLRDMYVGREPWYAERKELYQAHVGHNLFFEAIYDPSQYLRFYPLLGFNDEEGVYETMAVKVARAMLGLPVDTPPGRLAIDSGIAAAWQLQAGATEESLPEALREPGRNPRPYPLGSGRDIPWVITPDTALPDATSPATLWINYAGPPGGYPTLSYADALQRRTPPGAFRGKAVLVGVDRIFTYPVPTSATQRVAPPEVVAQAVQTIVDGRFMRPSPPAEAVAAIWLLSLMGALVVGVLRPLHSVIAMFGVVFLYLAAATALYRSGTLPDLVVGPGALLASGAAVGGFRYGREEIARRRIYDLFGRYVPRAVVAELVEKPVREALELGGVTREISVLFADIRGFTAFSEQFSAEEVLRRLNILLGVMVGCVFRHEGTVDKYIGDAIMVVFNAPLDQPDHVERAVRTALEMQRSMASVEGDLAFGIGIHIGDAVVGTVGTPERMEYTAIGSTVNIASRLCDTARKGEVVISQEVYDRLAERVEAEQRPPVRVKNIDRDLQTYLVMALRDVRGLSTAQGGPGGP